MFRERCLILPVDRLVGRHLFEVGMREKLRPDIFLLPLVHLRFMPADTLL